MTKRFGDLTAVDHIDLQVRRGDICGFLGPNGSGKTTFMRMLCGLLKADDGSGTCLGHDVIKESRAIKRKVGYMTQRFSFWEDLTVFENLDFVTRMYSMKNRRQAIRECMDQLGLSDRRNQLAGQLSGGWKQRLALAASLIHRPELLLLDEPTAGVDPRARRDFWEEIHQLSAQGLTFLIATHYMDEAERCHRLAFVAQGRLLTRGTVDEVIEESRLITWSVNESLYGHRDSLSGESPSAYKRSRLVELASDLRQRPGVQHTVEFGSGLHVSGSDEQALEQAIAPFRTEDYQWRRIEPGLEDVFIHLLDENHENREHGSAATERGG